MISPGQARPRTLGILPLAGALFVALVLCGLAQAAYESGNHTWGWAFAGVAALGFIAMCFWRPAIVHSMNLAVVVLGYFALACTLGTLTVQRADFKGQGVDEFRAAFHQSEAALFYRILHPFARPRRSLAISDEADARLKAMGRKFGKDYEQKQRRITQKMLAKEAVRQAAEKWAVKHRAFLGQLYRVVEAVRLSSAHTAWWFAAIAMLLVVNVSACTAVRLPRVSLRDAGFVATHTGLVLAAVGFFAGKFAISTGALGLAAGHAQRNHASTYRDSNTGKEVPLGFTLQLEAFKTFYRRHLVIQVPHPDYPDRVYFERTYKVKPGLAIRLDGGATTLTVKRIEPRARLQQELVEDPKAALKPLVQAAIAAPSGKTQKAWLFDDPEGLYVAPDNEVKIRFLESATPAEARRFAQQAQTPSLGQLVVASQETGKTARCRAWPGQKLSVGDYQIEVLECYADFPRRNTLPIERQTPTQPAVKLRVVKGVESEDRWVFANMDFAAMHQVKFDQFKCAFNFDAWTCPAKAKFLLVGGSAGLGLLPVTDAGAASSIPVKVGQSTRLGDTGYSLTVNRIIMRPKLREEIAPAPLLATHDPFADDSAPAIVLDVKAGSDRFTQHLISDGGKHEALGLPSGDIVAFTANTEGKPRAWLARLGVYEEGRRVLTSVVKVNHPLHYRGFIFYQWDARSDRPHYAGIKIVRDPAWPLVNIGLWMVLLGIVFMFYVRPFLRRRGEAAA